MTTGALSEDAIRPADLMADKAAAVEADRRYLLDRRERWVRVPCPACGKANADRFGDKHGFVYEHCIACGTVYTNPRPSPDLLTEFYRASENYAYWNAHIFPATESTRAERIFRPRASRLKGIADRIGATSDTLLDVGAAFGTFCSAAVESGLCTEAIALEPTPDLAQTCRERGFQVIESPLEAIEPGTVEADIVTAFEVIEHVFEPASFVDGCRRLVRPGGLLVLSCPNPRGFGVAELGVRSGTFDHEHLNYFNPRSLTLLVADRGFDVVETLTPGQLDADLVRQAALRGEADLSPTMREILVDRFDELGGPFQRFLAENGLSSHLWLVARRPTTG